MGTEPSLISVSVTSIALLSIIKNLAGLWFPGSWEVTPKSLEFPRWWECLCYLWWAPRTISEFCGGGRLAMPEKPTMCMQWSPSENSGHLKLVDTYWCARRNHQYHTFLNSRSRSCKLSNLRWVVGSPIFVASWLEVQVIWKSPSLWLVSEVWAIMLESP